MYGVVNMIFLLLLFVVSLVCFNIDLYNYCNLCSNGLDNWTEVFLRDTIMLLLTMMLLIQGV